MEDSVQTADVLIEIIEGLPQVNCVFVSDDRVLVVLDKQIFGIEYAMARLASAGDGLWILDDDAFNTTEINAFYGRNVLQDDVVIEQLNILGENIHVDDADKHAIVFRSDVFETNQCIDIVRTYCNAVTDFVAGIESVKDQIKK